MATSDTFKNIPAERLVELAGHLSKKGSLDQNSYESLDDAKLHAFISNLENILTGHELDKGFDKNWDLLLDHYETEARLSQRALLDEHKGADLTVARGWVVFDEDECRYICHKKEPLNLSHTIPAILVNDGTWKIFRNMLPIIGRHPYVRPITDKQGSSARSAIENLLRSLSSSYSFNTQPEDLTHAIDRLDQLLQGNPAIYDRNDSKEWINTLKTDDAFWSLIEAAISFGYRLAEHDIYSTGDLRDLVVNGLLQKRGKQRSKVTEAIARLMDKYEHEVGKPATALKLLKWAGGKNINGDLEIPKRLAPELHGVSWTTWNNAVKDLKKRK